MNNEKVQRINQALKDRKLQKLKVEKFRNKRIRRKFEKYQAQADQSHVVKSQDPNIERKLQFYKEVFSEKGSQKVSQKVEKSRPMEKQKNEAVTQIMESEQKVLRIRNKKKKFIRKMGERTKKGQPIMNNYVKYALAKLEQTMEKEKLMKKKEKLPSNAKANNGSENKISRSNQ